MRCASHNEHVSRRPHARWAVAVDEAAVVKRCSEQQRTGTAGRRVGGVQGKARAANFAPKTTPTVPSYPVPVCRSPGGRRRVMLRPPSLPAHAPFPSLDMCNVRSWCAVAVSRDRRCLLRSSNSIRCTIDLTACSWLRIVATALPTAWA